MRKYLVLIFVVLMGLIAVFASGEKMTNIKDLDLSVKGKNIRIGVLYINTPTGNKHWEGINEAVRGSEFFEYVDLKPYHYTTANDGFELLKELILSAEVDIILGPTESEIFVRAVGLEEKFAAKKVTVISGLATARVGNRKDGWFFRTNVDVTRRAQTIYDFLNKYWIATMAVLYEDTEFGRRAQRAFESELKSNNQEDRCMFLLYDTPPHPRKQLQAIIKNRPEAVGFFCEREEIALIYTELKKMNKSATPYDPMLFTILDVGAIANHVDDIYFVSLLSGNETPEANTPTREPEARALGYDLGIFVCRVIKDMNNGNKRYTQNFDGAKRLEFREQFRKQLSTLMTLSYKLDNSSTNMAFTKFENTALPGVFHLDGKNIKPLSISNHVNWWHKLVHKLKLIFAIYSNSLDSIKKSLLQVYKCHPSQIQRSKLIQKMEEDIDNEKEYLNKRRAGAKLLMRQFQQEQLKAEGFVPQNWDYDNPVDPRLIVREAAKYCAEYPEKVVKIDGLLIKQMEDLKERNKERYAEIKEFMEKELAETITLEGKLTVQIRKLFVLRRFDIAWLIKEELVDVKKLINKNYVDIRKFIKEGRLEKEELIEKGQLEEKDFKDEEMKTGSIKKEHWWNRLFKPKNEQVVHSQAG